MKQNHHPRPRSGFTLIELLVVIAIIGILAAMIIPITAALEKTKKRNLAKTELNQIAAMIDAYKQKTGFYPPDNPGNTVSNQLYFELSGCVFTNVGGVPTYITLDGSAQMTAVQCKSYFSADGIANSSATKRNTDDASAAQSFVTHLLPRQVSQLDPVNQPAIKVLTSSVQWPGTPGKSGPIPGAPEATPWQYRSTTATNNPGSFDLWVDILVGNKTNRISNWSANYQQL